ncbi:hypothetical protein [Paenibacillus sp. Pae15]|uniref:hypothetical protein n=1 Tax=Paenibacillus sp. Pae15 TaxID=2926018 RepID=UPI0006D111C2|nr:hypothetical protein [Paenibacillus sp. Pae15]
MNGNGAMIQNMSGYLVLNGFVRESEIDKIAVPLEKMIRNIETVLKYPIGHEAFPESGELCRTGN